MGLLPEALYRWLKYAAVAALVLGALLGGYLLRGPGTPAGPTEPIATSAAAATAEAPAEEAEVTMWTCSMHPQIQLLEPGLCPICQMPLIPVASGGGGGLRRFATSEASRALMDIQTTPVEKRFVEAEIRMVGKVTYDETRVRYITAWVAGRLDHLYVDYTGVTVAKGARLVYLYSPDLLAAQEELIQALRAVEELRASSLDIMRETARATVVAARERMRLWGLTREQIAEVEERGTPSDHMEIFAPIGGVVVHKNAQEGMYVKTGTRIYTIVDLSHLWVKLDAYESDLVWLRYGQEVSIATEAYPGETFAGRISFIDPVLDAKTRTVKVRVNLPNPDGKLKPEMFVRGVATAKVALGGRVVQPELVGKWISPMHPEIVKDGPGQCDVCGMDLVPVESLGYVAASELDAVEPIVIPRSAALVTGTRAIVYVEVPDTDKPTFEGREIVLGPRAGDYYLVRRGLKEGEMVVTNGAFKIDSALQIQAKPSMMTPEGGGGGGHQHGAPKAKAKAGEEAPAGEMPKQFVHQLHAVHAAAQAALEAAAGDDLEAAHGAFGRLQKAVDSTDETLASGHALMQWREVAMRLGNDAFEGSEVKTVREARRVAESLQTNMALLQDKLGIGQASEHGGVEVAEAFAVPEEFARQFGEVLAAYFRTQAALADDDVDAARQAATEAREALDGVDMALLTGDAHVAWMAHLAGIGKGLIAVDVGDIAASREGSAEFSREMLAALKAFDLAALGPVYLLECPMAFEGRGGTWLQADEATLNPYYGSAMPKCGGVIETVVAPQAAHAGEPGDE